MLSHRRFFWLLTSILFTQTHCLFTLNIPKLTSRYCLFPSPDTHKFWWPLSAVASFLNFGRTEEFAAPSLLAKPSLRAENRSHRIHCFLYRFSFSSCSSFRICRCHQLSTSLLFPQCRLPSTVSALAFFDSTFLSPFCLFASFFPCYILTTSFIVLCTTV